MRRACGQGLRPFLTRGVSGVSPTIFLRPRRAVAVTDPADPALLRAKISGLYRFTKAQLNQLAEGEAAKPLLQQALSRYEGYLNDIEAFLKVRSPLLLLRYFRRSVDCKVDFTYK